MKNLFNRLALTIFLMGFLSISSFSQSSDELLKYLHGGKDKTWKAVGFYLEGFEGFQQCRLDDKFVLSSDGSYRYDGGKKLCGGEDNKRIKTGIWEKASGENTLTFNKNTKYAYEVAILSAEGGFLVLTTTYLGLTVKGVYQSKN